MLTSWVGLTVVESAVEAAMAPQQLARTDSLSEWCSGG
jgi:hypothetical protein